MEKSVKEILEKQLELLSEASEENKEETSKLVSLTAALVGVAHELIFCGGNS